MADLLILGNGEYEQVVKELAGNKYSVINFLDDNNPTVIGKIADLEKYKGKYNAIVAMGNLGKRRELFEKLESAGFNIPTLISDKAYISPLAIIEPGCVIEPMKVVQINAVIKKGCFINSGAVVNHNTTVNEFCQIDCNAVAGADAEVPAGMHLNYGQVITKVTRADHWEFSE